MISNGKASNVIVLSVVRPETKVEVVTPNMIVPQPPPLPPRGKELIRFEKDEIPVVRPSLRCEILHVEIDPTATVESLVQAVAGQRVSPLLTTDRFGHYITKSRVRYNSTEVHCFNRGYPILMSEASLVRQDCHLYQTGFEHVAHYLRAALKLNTKNERFTAGKLFVDLDSVFVSGKTRFVPCLDCTGKYPEFQVRSDKWWFGNAWFFGLPYVHPDIKA